MQQRLFGVIWLTGYVRSGNYRSDSADYRTALDGVPKSLRTYLAIRSMASMAGLLGAVLMIVGLMAFGATQLFETKMSGLGFRLVDFLGPGLSILEIAAFIWFMAVPEARKMANRELEASGSVS